MFRPYYGNRIIWLHIVDLASKLIGFFISQSLPKGAVFDDTFWVQNFILGLPSCC